MCDTMGAVQDMDSFEEGYRLLREDCGLIDLDWKRVILFSGEDRKGWLQGQVTNDLRKLEPGGSLNFCLCKATGQLEAIATMWALPNHLIAIAHQRGAGALLERVSKNVILEDVQAQEMEGEVLSVQGPEATRNLSKLFTLPTLDAGTVEFEGAEVTVLRSNRSGYGGWDIVLPKSATKASKKLRKQFVPVSREAFSTACLEAGIPSFALDTDEKTLPPELGQAFVNSHVSFSKGCYAGQEVLMRIHSRGHTNRSWVGLLSDQTLEVGDTVSHLSRDEAGRVTRVAFSPDFGFIASAMVRNEAAFAGEIVKIRRDGVEIEAEVQEMPLLRFG